MTTSLFPSRGFRTRTDWIAQSVHADCWVCAGVVVFVGDNLPVFSGASSQRRELEHQDSELQKF